MNIRERIADLISGGAITKLKEDRNTDAQRFVRLNAYAHNRLVDLLKSSREKENQLLSQIEIISRDNKNGWFNINRFKTALEEIANIKTPTSSTLAKRMAQIAKDALE